MPIDDGVVLFELDNGLEVAIVSDSTVPLVTALAAFRAGAFVEDEEINGYSHLLEHMMFKGSAEVPGALAFRQRLDQLGISSNATTSNNRVTFYYTLQRQHLEEGLELMADALVHPALDEEELRREISVVLAEHDLAEANHESASYEAVLDLLYPMYRSRKTALGAREVIEVATRADLVWMHDTYYVPNNALLILSGDIGPEEGRRLVEQSFGEWERGPDPFDLYPVPEHPNVAPGNVRVVSAPVTTPTVTLAWQGPDGRPDTRADAIVGDVLERIALQRDHPFRSLVDPELFALAAGLSNVTDRYTGTFVAYADVPEGNEEAVIRELHWNTRAIASVTTETHIRAAQDEIWYRWFTAADDPTVVAFRLADLWGVGHIGDYEDYLDTAFGIGSSELQAFTHRYFATLPHAIVVTASEDYIANADLTAERVGSWLQ